MTAAVAGDMPPLPRPQPRCQLTAAVACAVLAALPGETLVTEKLIMESRYRAVPEMKRIHFVHIMNLLFVSLCLCCVHYKSDLICHDLSF